MKETQNTIEFDVVGLLVDRYYESHSASTGQSTTNYLGTRFQSHEMTLIVPSGQSFLLKKRQYKTVGGKYVTKLKTVSYFMFWEKQVDNTNYHYEYGHVDTLEIDDMTYITKIYKA